MLVPLRDIVWCSPSRFARALEMPGDGLRISLGMFQGCRERKVALPQCGCVQTGHDCFPDAVMIGLNLSRSSPNQPLRAQHREDTLVFAAKASSDAGKAFRQRAARRQPRSLPAVAHPPVVPPPGC